MGRRHITDKPHHPEKRLHPIQAQAVEDPATGMARAGVITTERQIIPPNFVNQLALVIRLGPQLVVGGKNKGVAGPSPVVVMAKTDIAKWRCSPLDKKLELPITIHTRPTPQKIFPCDSFSLFLDLCYFWALDCPNVCISVSLLICQPCSIS